jgi:hypothetical protein
MSFITSQILITILAAWMWIPDWRSKMRSKIPSSDLLLRLLKQQVGQCLHPWLFQALAAVGVD